MQPSTPQMWIVLNIVCVYKLYLLTYLADRTWRRPPGRPLNKWLDKLRDDSAFVPWESYLSWRRAVSRGHGGATTRRPSPATRP